MRDTRLEVKALALAIGIVFGVFTFIIAIVAITTGVGLNYLNQVGVFHPGWSPSLLGVCIMTFWMFVYGLIGGALVAVIYNFFTMKSGK